MWTGYLTTRGKQMLADWVNGSNLYIKDIRGGTGTVPESELKDLTDLTDYKDIGMIVSSESITEGRLIRCRFSAAPTSYTLNQIGLYACLDYDALELFAIYQNTEGQEIPDVTTAEMFQFTFDAILAVSNEGSLTVEINSSAAIDEETMEKYVKKEVGLLREELDPHAFNPVWTNYTTKTSKTQALDANVGNIIYNMLTAHEKNTANPHNVTKNQIGLGRVANLYPEDFVNEYCSFIPMVVGREEFDLILLRFKASYEIPYIIGTKTYTEGTQPVTVAIGLTGTFEIMDGHMVMAYPPTFDVSDYTHSFENSDRTKVYYARIPVETPFVGAVPLMGEILIRLEMDRTGFAFKSAHYTIQAAPIMIWNGSTGYQETFLMCDSVDGLLKEIADEYLELEFYKYNPRNDWFVGCGDLK